MNRDEIIKEFNDKGFTTFQIIHYSDFPNYVENLRGNILCDVTGLPKSVIFDSIRKSLVLNKSVFFTITEPEMEYPLDNEIQNVFNKYSDLDSSLLLKEVSNLIKGEQGPYSLINLLPHYSNISEPRVLFSYAPIKHERLYTLLDEREYEKINIIVPNGASPKHRLAKVSAEFSLRKFNNAEIHYIDDSNIRAMLEILAKDYYTYFILNNFPFEIALTGSKLQTISAAIFSSVFKISQCWYVKPKSWDKNRFSKGFLSTSFFQVSINDPKS